MIEKINQNEKQELNENEILDLFKKNKMHGYYYTTHKLKNKKHPNGRINAGKDKNGHLVARTISPYAKDFFDNIEPKIEKLIKLLIKKKYYTYSSCEGHCTASRRFIGIVFTDLNSRKIFREKIDNLNLNGVHCEEFDTKSNTGYDQNGRDLFINNEELSEEDRKYQIEEEIYLCNTLFHQKNKKYYFLDLVIFDEQRRIDNPIKKIVNIFNKLFLWEKTTNKIYEMIKKDDFPKNKF